LRVGQRQLELAFQFFRAHRHTPLLIEYLAKKWGHCQ